MTIIMAVDMEEDTRHRITIDQHQEEEEVVVHKNGYQRIVIITTMWMTLWIEWIVMDMEVDPEALHNGITATTIPGTIEEAMHEDMSRKELEEDMGGDMIKVMTVVIVKVTVDTDMDSMVGMVEDMGTNSHIINIIRNNRTIRSSHMEVDIITNKDMDSNSRIIHRSKDTHRSIMDLEDSIIMGQEAAGINKRIKVRIKHQIPIRKEGNGDRQSLGI